MKIAVIGSGISGLSAAYYLSKKNSVDLFESENHFGGHSHTINISYQQKKQIAVDIGFIVFNEKIDELNQETDTLLEEIDKWQM